MYQLDPEQARALARRFGQCGDLEIPALAERMHAESARVETMLGDLTAGVRNMTWHGQRAAWFDQRWETELRPALLQARDSLTGIVALLRSLQGRFKEAEQNMDSQARDTETVDRSAVQGRY